MIDPGETQTGVGRRGFLLGGLCAGLSLTVFGSLLEACRRVDRPSTGTADLPPLEKELHIYNWSDYIAEDTVSNFEREFRVRVTYDTYESNEEMVAKLQAGASGYDIIVPSGYILPVLVATDLIAPLRRSYLPNSKNLSPIFQDLPADPQNQYTVPWQWGTSGIAYRVDKVRGPVDSWAVFQDPQYAGKMTMMDDAREVIGSQLRYRGHSLNSANPDDLAGAKSAAFSARKKRRASLPDP